MAKLVYIGGYGQSGSTLFEYLMTANPDAVACGEIVNGWERARKELELAAADCAMIAQSGALSTKLPVVTRLTRL